MNEMEKVHKWPSPQKERSFCTQSPPSGGIQMEYHFESLSQSIRVFRNTPHPNRGFMLFGPLLRPDIIGTKQYNSLDPI
jgi:hypothetical protein